MKRKWLTAAGVLVIAGILLFGIGFAQGGVDDLSEDVEKKTSEYAPEEVTSLFAELTSADVTVEASEDGKVTVEYYTAGHDGIDVAVKDGVLKITQWNKRDWWEYFSFHLADSRKVTVKVPMSLESLDVSTASGEIEVKGAQVAGEGAIGSTSGDITASGTFAGLDLGTTSGEITARDIAAGGDVIIGTTSGEVSLARVRADGDMSVSTTSGSIKMDGITAKTFDVGAVSGDIKATNLNAADGTGQIAFTTTSGEIEADMARGGEISFSSVSGGVEGKLPGVTRDYSIDSGTVSGENSLPEHLSGGTKILTASTTSGDIQIEFEDD